MLLSERLKSAPLDNSKNTPEKSLLYAMLQRAVADLRSSDRTVKKESVKWLWSDTNKKWGFFWLMEHLNMEQMIPDLRREAFILLENVDYTHTTNNRYRRKANQHRGRTINIFKYKKEA